MSTKERHQGWLKDSQRIARSNAELKLRREITIHPRELRYHSGRRRIRMRRVLANRAILSLLTGVLLAAGAASSAAQATMPKVGDMAPDFKLNYFDGNDLKAVSLDQYRGKKNVVLAFFIFAFTGG
jgi:AhpC/TSA family